MSSGNLFIPCPAAAQVWSAFQLAGAPTSRDSQSSLIIPDFRRTPDELGLVGGTCRIRGIFHKFYIGHWSEMYIFTCIIAAVFLASNLTVASPQWLLFHPLPRRMMVVIGRSWMLVRNGRCLRLQQKLAPRKGWKAHVPRRCQFSCYRQGHGKLNLAWWLLLQLSLITQGKGICSKLSRAECVGQSLSLSIYLPGIFWPRLAGSWWMEYSLCPAGKAIDASQTLQLASETNGLVVWCGLMTAPSCFEGGVQIAFWKQNLSGTLFIFLKRCIRCVNSFVCVFSGFSGVNYVIPR